MKRLLMGLIALTCFPMPGAGQARPILTHTEDEIVISNCGIKPELIPANFSKWNQIVTVFTNEAFLRRINQPVSGKYSLKGYAIHFEPTYTFAAGVNYYAVLSLKALSKYTEVPDELPRDSIMTFSFTVPHAQALETRVEAVYPESDALPANLLRMYIYFSSPMMPGEAYNHIRLYTEHGERVEKAFLVVDQELWDTERKRFTLLFDPGRIKRTLKSNIELGPPLEEGSRYKLVIDSAWRDANGNYLRNSVRKTFTVTLPQRSKLCKTCLRLISPASDSKGNLEIVFDRPIDRVLVSKYISIIHSDFGPVRGTVQLANDVSWTFTPDIAWKEGNYEIVIHPLLEDVAGNNFNNAFDIDLATEKQITSSERITIPFVVNSAAR